MRGDDDGAEQHKEEDEDDDAGDVRPHIHTFVVAREQTFARLPARVMVNAIPAQQVRVILRKIFSFVSAAHISKHFL